mmetsp:Transcript_2528/g.7196  ORF Transcript_2528/g.7196 Transcript_2528/m.7196 type:complete len:196 (-) Transcript_2528:217-804(-)
MPQAFTAKSLVEFYRQLSEVLVFVALGLELEDSVIDEESLKKVLFLSGTKTPEGVFSWLPRGPLIQVFGTGARVRLSVEVKRVAFLELPAYLPDSYRRQYAAHSLWFLPLIQDAVNKINKHFVRRFQVKAHIIGVAVPLSMAMPERRAIRRAIAEAVETSECPVPCDFWIVPEPDCVFGQLLKPRYFLRRGGSGP